MTRYIIRAWLCWLGWAALVSGIVLQVGTTGTINGAALIPLPFIYVSYRLRDKKEPRQSGNSGRG